ncbi:hypothetical protein SUGI_0196120 [Cryptomeria japonica]|nr:hypothetical protein SUGI_0196120 [Cryptomeria japonica]
MPLESGVWPTPQQILFMKSINGILLVVSPSHLEIWSSTRHRLRLGKYLRDPESIQKEGQNLQAVWSSDTKTIVVLTSSFLLHVYKVNFSGKHLRFGGKDVSGLSLVNIKYNSSKKAPFAGENVTISNFVSDDRHILLGLSNGSLHLLSWNGEHVEESYLLEDPVSVRGDDNALDNDSSVHPGLNSQRSANFSPKKIANHTSISQLELSLALRLLVVVFGDGHILLCSTSKKGLRHMDGIKAERWLGVSDAACIALSPEQEILAVGTRRGTVDLYDLEDGATLIRTVSLYDWGYSVEDTGAVNCIAWTPDNCAFAVGWKLRGLTVWSASGCRLMSTIRQIGINSASSPMVKSNQEYKCEPMVGGVACMGWDEYGYRLFAVEQRTAERVLAIPFGKCCLNRGISGATHMRQVIYAEDRVLIVQSEDDDELKLQHLVLPVSYISQNWPVLHVAASKDGMYLAIAGRQGMILYDLRAKKWRVFGDVTQEQRIHCVGLLWLGKIVVICNYNDSSNTYELLFYPRYHLDQTSLLCRRALLGRPMVMDICQDYILVTYRPFDVHVFHAQLSGELSPSNSPVLQLSAVRELSIMTAKKHPVAMRFIPDHFPKEGTLFSKSEMSPRDNLIESGSETFQRQPKRCLILRLNGELSLLDLDEGRERELTDSVELFWVTSELSEGKANLIDEVSWLDYGHRGMQVWYPSPGLDPFQLQDFLQLDPELEFDREVYPLGLLPSAGVVVGISQRMSFSACTEFPCFEPAPQAQTILHCLLRHLLQRDKAKEALGLARLSANKPHFSHCLEWLLFTVFDADISSQSSTKNNPVSVKSSASSLLEQTCALIRNFPEYLDVVVSVARKTDGRHWADLFAAAGRSTDLFEDCFQRRWYRTAACYILIIAKLEGPAVSQYNALRLLQATLDESMYELAGELVRFLMRSGRDYELLTESEKTPQRFLGSFLFRSSSQKQPIDMKSPSNKESSAHIASVKSILECHASYLMSGKELSKLVAFVKGTQFDLVEYLQRERNGSARLENFASGLQIIGQKLGMDLLQSRLDAEFLLAHMCTVSFKEWIVVLATLLRRAEVLFDLFRDDMRLWKAYSSTLRSQPDFAEYKDLLNSLEEGLSSVANEVQG